MRKIILAIVLTLVAMFSLSAAQKVWWFDQENGESVEVRKELVTDYTRGHHDEQFNYIYETNTEWRVNYYWFNGKFLSKEEVFDLQSKGYGTSKAIYMGNEYRYDVLEDEWAKGLLANGLSSKEDKVELWVVYVETPEQYKARIAKENAAANATLNMLLNLWK